MIKRTTKSLSQRIDRGYLKKVPALLRWRRILTLACLAVPLAWLGLSAVSRDNTPYTAGAISTPHAFLGKNCATCHGGQAGIAKRVTDQACASCHDAPLHSAQQVSAPQCGDCHVEHRGVLRLTGGQDRECLRCHSDLKTKNAALTVDGHIDSFATHPQFAAVKAGKDPVGFKFNHAKHMAEMGQKCSDCHTAAPQDASASQPHSHVSSRALMTNPTYAATCMPCHALTFDDKDTDAAPHDKPAVVVAFVKDSLAKYIAAHPGDLGKNGTPGSVSAWVAFKVNAAEKQLWSTTCEHCHSMGPADGSGLPTVPPAKATARWFTKASFDHSAHQELTCESCHAAATKSTASSDMLLPGIETCRNCHNSGEAWGGNTCSTCHRYHDWSKEKGVDGKFKIKDVTRLMPAHGGAGPS
jgi:hypothetical protein